MSDALTDTFIPPDDLPAEELPTPTTEEVIENLKNRLAGDADAQNWQPRLMEILDAFEKFLVEKPSPPQEWFDRVGDRAEKFDYHQLVLPFDFVNPELDDLENVRLLRKRFAEQKSYMALEHSLMTRNRFLWTDGHIPQNLAPIIVPCPSLILELPETPSTTTGNPMDGEEWDCAMTIFPDGSYWAYNLDLDEMEELGEDLGDMLVQYGDLLAHLEVVIPVEGYDYGLLA
jgi:hypothetical protein